MPAQTFQLLLLIAHEKQSRLFYSSALYKSLTYLLSTGWLLGWLHKEPNLSSGVRRSNRPCRSGQSGVQCKRRVIQQPAQTVLGEPRSNTGHEAGQWLGYRIPICYLHLQWWTTEAGRGFTWSLPERVDGAGIWKNHNWDQTCFWILLCWRLPPAVSS